MPETVVGWCAHCWGYIGSGKFCILGVAGYNKPIWDVLALQGEREEAVERLYGAKFVELFRIRKAVSEGSLWDLGSLLGTLCWFFSLVNIHRGRYSVFKVKTPFSTCLRRRERMDGVGWCWMTFPLGSLQLSYLILSISYLLSHLRHVS